MCRATLAALEPLGHVGIDLRRPHLDQGELGGDEEAVERHQQEAQDQAPSRADERFAGHGGEQGQGHGRLIPESGRTADSPPRAPDLGGCCWPEERGAAVGLGGSSLNRIWILAQRELEPWVLGLGS